MIGVLGGGGGGVQSLKDLDDLSASSTGQLHFTGDQGSLVVAEFAFSMNLFQFQGR